MGKFDDLEDFLEKERSKRKPRATTKKGKNKAEEEQTEDEGIFKSFHLGDKDKRIIREDSGSKSDHGREIANEIGQFLSKKFGGDFQIKSMEGGIAIEHAHRHEEVDEDKLTGILNRLRDQNNHLANALTIVLKQLGATPTCVDANGRELKVGDQLSVPGGYIKTVLEIGFGYCFLSNTEDQQMSDGVWFEPDLKKMNFIKK